MTTRALLRCVVPVLLVACSKPEPSTQTAPPAGVGAGSQAAAPAAPAGPATAPAAAPEATSTMPATASAPAEAVIASQDTNWSGVVAEVTEFRRKGNTLTAKVRLRNAGADEVQPEIKFDET